jgi:FAD:protein FMN transferase
MAERGAGAALRGARMRRVEHTMGTVFSFDVRGGDPGRMPDALDAAAAWLREVDRMFSTYRADSQISRLAAGAVCLADCATQVREVHALCEAARRRTGGWFSAAYAGGFDPTGLVKGWAVERATAMLAGAGADAVCVNGGGDVQVYGGPWRIGVGHPGRPGTLASVVRAGGDLAVATSGPAERGCHILDPHTGRPAGGGGLASVTVVCRSLTDADAAATAAFAMGARARSWLEAQPDMEGFAVRTDGTVWRTPGFGGSAVPEPGGR